MREATLGLLLIVAGLSGCIGGDEAAPDRLQENHAGRAGASEIELAPPEVQNGTLHVDVDIPVVTIGFPNDAVEALEEQLGNRSLHPWNIRGLPLVAPSDRGQTIAEEGSTGSQRSAERPMLHPGPIRTTAKFHVEPVSEALAENLSDELGEMPGEGNANQLEAFLAEALARDGVDVDPNRPLLVLVGTQSRENAPGNWRYAWPDGTNDTVRVFGEREPLLVVDLDGSALAPDETEAVVDLVHNATRYRLLQGTTYAPPAEDCHGVTLVTAVRRASSIPAANATGFVEERITPQRLAAAFGNLTGDRVHVDSKVLALPEDDPVLDAVSRGSYSTPRYQTLREYLAANWEDYWVEHEGCEGYLSVQFHTDRANTCTLEALGRCSSGTATYDEDTGYRIAFSWFSPPPEPTGTVAARSNPTAKADPYNGINYLHVHEVGHLFGLNHPHDIPNEEPLLDAGDPGPPQFTRVNETFQTVWSAMSYASGSSVQDFGAVDRANYERNRAAKLLVTAHENNQVHEAALDRALDHVSNYEWSKASGVLAPSLGDEPGGASASQRMPGVAS